MVASMLRAQRRDPAKAQAMCAFATNYPLANRQLRSPLILRYRMQRDKPLKFFRGSSEPLSRYFVRVKDHSIPVEQDDGFLSCREYCRFGCFTLAQCVFSLLAFGNLPVENIGPFSDTLLQGPAQGLERALPGQEHGDESDPISLDTELS